MISLEISSAVGCSSKTELKIMVNLNIYFTGFPDQIGGNFKLILLHNQKTCRKCKDSFGIVRNWAIEYVFRYYDLGPSLDPINWD